MWGSSGRLSVTTTRKGDQMNLGQLYHWGQDLSKNWSGVSRHFRANVSHFSRAIVYAGSSRIRRIAGHANGRAESQRRRLQRFLNQAHDMKHFFAIWSDCVSQELGLTELVLVVDETKLRDQLGVMVVGAVYEKRCIPLAWRVYRANSECEYPAEGQVGMIVSLLHAIASGLPAGQKVRVLADRGIGTSPTLMQAVMALGWTFLFRVTKQSKIWIESQQKWLTFYDQVTEVGQRYEASGTVFKKRGQIPAHVRVLWRENAQDKWALVTNDPHLSGWEYAQRMWIEEAFRDLKSHGWQVEACSDFAPQRMERFWILLVVAYVWMLLLGKAYADCGKASALKKHQDGSKRRQWSLFREGRQAFLTYRPDLVFRHPT
jgi:hypothetical protein